MNTARKKRILEKVARAGLISRGAAKLKKTFGDLTGKNVRKVEKKVKALPNPEKHFVNTALSRGMPISRKGERLLKEYTLAHKARGKSRSVATVGGAVAAGAGIAAAKKSKKAPFPKETLMPGGIPGVMAPALKKGKR